MRRWLGIGAVVVLVALVAIAIRLLVLPPSASVPDEADAVALLSGGSGDRLPRAVALVRRGIADVLVIPNGTDPKWTDARRLCTRPQTYTVICPRPDPDTTRGEARALSRLARTQGWEQLVVVTSRYHVTRARTLLDRCVGADVSVVASVPHDGPVTWLRHVAHEGLGLVESVALDRGC